MSHDFVAEAGNAIVRMKAETRKRQLIAAGVGALGTLTLLYWCGGLGFVVMTGTVVALLYLDIYETKLERMLESVGSAETREFFVSSRDGLFVATQNGLFVEKIRRMMPYEDNRRTVLSVQYDAAGHQLVVRISVRHPAMSKVSAAPKEETLQLAFPRATTPQEAQRIAKRIAGWAAMGTEQTLP